MAWTITQKNLKETDASGASETVALTGIAAGSLIVLCVKHEGAATTLAISDGTTSATAATKKSHANGDLHCQFFYYLSHAGGTKTFTLTLGAARVYKRFHVWEIALGGGAAQFASEPSGGGATGSSTAPDSGSMTTAQSTGAAFGLYGEYATRTVSARLIGGLAADDSQGSATIASSWAEMLSATLSGSASCTLSWSATWMCCGIAFDQAVAGGSAIVSIIMRQHKARRN